ncbi:MAG TPA: S8 family serine peptidase, partial [Anaerolineae bacterium]|nr:S8 family serine peptidase [Anaerolineae bacterium]
ISSNSIEPTSPYKTLQTDELPPAPSQQPQPLKTQPPAVVRTIHLKSGEVTPGAPDRLALNQLARSDGGRIHVLLQLDFIPREAAKAEYEKHGVKLLTYVPDYAWIASVPGSDPAAVLNLPGVTWIGPLTVNDKLDPAIVKAAWGSWSLTPDGTVAVYVATHPDEDLATTRALVEKYGGKITGEVIGIQLSMVEMPQQNLRALAAEEAVQWIEPAAPPWGPTNDGIRQQIGVNTLQAAPYSLNGTNIDVLVYDSGQVGDHTDFGTRLIHGDADTVSEHSTHVAGTVGGSGANSAAHGGTALQWRGMAPNADLISYGTQYSGSGPIFYQNVPDIENDFAVAQNTYGADLGTASLGSNVYSNYPLSCTLLMGKYGASDVLIDQIVRGGNAVVGVGDKYITTWAVGNERNNTGSCSNTYNSIAPPAAAKNPIHVGASNTNDNSMTSFSSWGPTQDGRIKPIVVAGGCQNGGDGGITSTDNSPANDYTQMCGTSMATPAVGGSIALMLQHYRAVYGVSNNFWPSTAKAILMQTADDFGNPGPDYQWGFGQVDIVAAVQLISRTAFLQNSVAQGDVDVFYFPVLTNTTPAQVSLAWDDYQATFIANPTLINNLDVELVDPSGTVWRSWVLNPASPASNATRGVNNRDNQEQVTVPNPAIGTWLVRVKGTTVPQGPQDYSLACEGCRALNAGVCQFKVSGEPLPLFAAPVQATVVSEDKVSVMPETPIAGGEQWQRSLEEKLIDSASAQADREAWARIEAAHAQGPSAVLALRDQLTGRTLELAQAEIRDAEAQLNRSSKPPIAPLAPGAVNRVGLNGACTYPTIQQAVDAANNGDTVQVSSGMYFENVTITGSKVITIEGGYDSSCTSVGTDSAHIEGSLNTANTFNISGGVILLRNLEVAWGGGDFGAGVDVLGSAQVTLDNVDIFNNHGIYGGGIYIASGAAVTATNGSSIHDNTATSDGGGVRVWNKFFGYSNDSDVYNNCAPNGGGYSVPGGTVSLNSADVYGNLAAAPLGKGGGFHLLPGGSVTLTGSVFVYFLNQAYNGAGIYADAANLYLGSGTTFRDNIAANEGGGLYLTNNSKLTATGTYLGQAGSSLANEAARGAGLYAVTSTINFAGQIINNLASEAGAGIYAANSTVNLINATVGGTNADEAN